MHVSEKWDLTDPRVLDRLVDGELSDEQERSLVAQLDQTPDGWRRCALTFLEARCWQREAMQWQQLASQESDRATPAGRAWWSMRAGRRQFGSWSTRWPTAAALCAVFLLAFGVGMLLPDFRHRSSAPSFAQSQPVQKPVDQALASTSSDKATHPASVTTVQEPGGSEGLVLGDLKFVDSNGHHYRLPVYDWNQQVADQLMYPSQIVSPDVVRRLKRHQVRSHQRYVPVELEDGRKVVIPVQEVDIVPVGGTAY